MQVHGVDYDTAHTQVLKISKLPVLVSLEAQLDLHVQQMEITSVFWMEY